MMRSSRASDDDGLSMVELIVAILVSTIVLVGMAVIFTNSWRTQERVSSVSEATNQGQVIGSTIERAIRNGLYFEVTESGTVLKVRTSLAGSLRCQGFRLTDGSAQLATSSAALSATNTAWAQWQKAIEKRGTTAYFTRNGDNSLSYSFNIGTKNAPVSFSGRVLPRSIQQPATGSGGCW